MPEYCSCGTTLVENARFCHRCGRPTGSLVVEEVDATPPPIPSPAIVAPVGALSQLPVSFSNPVALRVAFIMSLAIVPVELALNALSVVWWLGAGWCAVLLYRRLTGSVLSVRAGAQLGTITGVLTFVGIAIGTTIAMVFTGQQIFAEMVKQNPEVKQVLNDPTMMVFAVLFGLAFVFALVVGVCAAGGALGARFTARKA